MPKLTVQGGEIYYEVHGAGPPLLLISGLGGMASYWRPQLAALTDRFQVILHDHRGTGQSEKSRIRYSVDQMTADVIGLMDGLGVRDAHVLGHSTGGAIGQTLALKHGRRLKSLVLFATWCRKDPFFDRAFAVRKETLAKSGPEGYVRASNLSLHSPWWVSKNHEQLLKEEAMALAAFPPAEILTSRIDAICAFDVGDRLKEVKAPTLVVCAKDDYVTPPYMSEDIARTLPGAELVMLETGGHVCSKTTPTPFNQLIRGWFVAQADGTAWVRPG
ncbi:MAG: pyrimidine utilization protein D [Proteobacteria bacterium]|nr:pyrimidine utilization protein D [Pseudomonadota bacterium]